MATLLVIVSYLVAAIVGALIGFYYYNKNAHSFWEKRGVKGPKPWPVLGTFLDISGPNRLNKLVENTRKYGKVYGAYRGYKPDLIVADAEILQQVCIKDFDVFTNHMRLEFVNHYQRSFVFGLQDEHWKRVRALMSPTFTSGKIKRMFQLLDACADDLVNCFQEQLVSGGEEGKRALVHMKNTYNMFTMDAIATCCYGLKLERAKGSVEDLKTVGKRDSFVGMAMKLFEFSKFRFILATAGPKLLLRLLNFQVMPLENFENLATVMRQLVDKRRRSEKKLDDYLQLLIDAKLDDKVELNEMDSQENHHAGLTSESLLSDQEKMVKEVSSNNDKGQSEDHSTSKQNILSEHEIVTNAMFLLVVGLETTASMLTHCSYLLSFHPEVQEKLYAEVSKIVEYKEGEDKTKTCFSYEALTSCQYLDAVISETLRYLTPASVTDRIASRDYHFEKYNFTIPKGTIVSTAFHAIMHDPEYWPEPERFDPERFMPGNKEKIVPGSYCPFGIGPRHCLGMRFSLTESKLALAKIIMKYKFEPNPEAKFPPELSKSIGIANVKHPEVYITQRVS